MYQKNELQRGVLILPEEVLFHAPTRHEVDPRTILAAIIVAEERFIRPVLGHDLYELLVSEKNKEVTEENLEALQGCFGEGSEVELGVGDIVNAAEQLSEANLRLWKQYLWKLCAEAVLVSAVPDAFVQFGSNGVVHANAPASVMNQSGAVTPELSAVRWVMEKKIQERIDPLAVALQDFICRNKASYPTYKNCPECGQRSEPGSKRSPIILNIYEDDE